MKKINNKFILAFSLIATLFLSCGEQENIVFDNANGFLQFAASTGSTCLPALFVLSF